MSAQQGAPALGRAQTGTMTRRAMAVAGATLCAPLVAAVGLAAIGTAGGGDQAQMGTLAGAQGLRGSTVAATNPAPPPASSPTADAFKAKGDGPREASAAESKRQPSQETQSQPRSNPAPSTRAPTHKPPTQVTSKPPRSRVPVTPTSPAPTVDPSTPGAPTPGSTGGSDDSGSSSGAGSGTDPGSSSGSGSGSSSNTAYPGGPSGQSGGD
jgi:hypothetical protein